jgi:phospholipase/carboxylesterase
MTDSEMILQKAVERFTSHHHGFGISRRNFLKGSLGVLAAQLFVNCGESSPTESSIEPTLKARPRTPNVTPTRGLSQLGLGQTRDGVLYVPQSYSPNKPAPLFVAMHGAGGDGKAWFNYYARAEARGMILLAPDSRSTTWDLIRTGFGPDVTFLDSALEHTFARCRIDPTHITLGGFSDGATYALSLGVSNGDLFTHLVGYSPGFLAPSDPIVGKPRIYISHGKQDAILPVGLSQNVIVPRLINDGYDVTYRQFEGGHTIPAEISDAALDWFVPPPIDEPD